MHSGLYHCRFACKSRKRDPYSMIYAFFIAITQNTTLEEIARVEGKKSYLVGWVDPSTNKGNYYVNREALSYDPNNTITGE